MLFVMLDEPQGTHYSALVSGPLGAAEMGYAIQCLGAARSAAVVSA